MPPSGPWVWAVPSYAARAASLQGIVPLELYTELEIELRAEVRLPPDEALAHAAHGRFIVW